MKILSILLMIAPAFAISAEAANTGSAIAAGAQKVYFKGVEISPIVELFRAQMQIANKPFNLYHWGKNEKLVSSSEVQNGSASAGLEFLRKTASGFYAGLSEPGRDAGNVLGAGLYMAVDPLFTESYGGNDPRTWNLLELRIPKGFRILDLDNNNPKPSTAVAYTTAKVTENILNTFQCDVSPMMKGYRDYLEHDPQSKVAVYFILAFLQREFQPPCAELLHHIFAEVLKLDGISYSYGSTSFRDCNDSSNFNSRARRIAFVITSDKWMANAESRARLYTSETKDNVNARTEIESLFASQGQPPHWKDLKSKSLFTDMKPWLQKNIFNCGAEDFLGGLGEGVN